MQRQHPLTPVKKAAHIQYQTNNKTVKTVSRYKLINNSKISFLRLNADEVIFEGNGKPNAKF